jgi:caffeoyl-CoA O-methyltransferase
MARDTWRRSPHGRKIDLRLGPALETIKGLRGPFDAVFIDADKLNYPKYWDACVPLVRPGGLLIVDNVLWSGEVLKPNDAPSRAIAALNRKAARDRRVENVIVPLRDGVLLAVKRG